MEQQNKRSSSFMKVLMLILPITVTTIATDDSPIWEEQKENHNKYWTFHFSYIIQNKYISLDYRIDPDSF